LPVKLEDLVAGLLRQELDLYRLLRSRIDAELEAIDGDDMDLLMSILQEKQSIISRQELLMERWGDVSSELGISEGRDEPVFWKALASAVGERGYEGLISRVREIQDLVSASIDFENVAQEKMAGKLSELRSRMSRVANGKKAVRGYMGSI